MHYKDGTEARLGDVVKGTGYNVSGEIVGTVVYLTPGSQSCNILVAHLLTEEIAPCISAGQQLQMAQRAASVADACPDAGRENPALIKLNVEYGQCDEFELVHRPE